MLNQRFFVSTRSYILPFTICIIAYHIPMFILTIIYSQYEWTNGCLLDPKLSFWLIFSACLHTSALILGTTSILKILCSPVHNTSSTNYFFIGITFLVQVIDFFWCVYGKLISNNQSENCENLDVYETQLNSIERIITYGIVFSTICLFLWIVLSHACGTYSHKDKESFKKLWTKRCHCMYRVFSCGKPEEQSDVFEALGELLSNIFVAEKPNGKFQTIEFGDLVFCLGLVRKSQNIERRKYRQQLRASVEDLTNYVSDIPEAILHETPTINLLEDAYHYSLQACATYGWMFYVFYHPLKIFKIFGCCMSKPKGQVIHKDLILSINKASFLHYSGVRNEDLLYLNCHNELFRSPYAITKDENRKELVISIRGSMSFADFIVDGFARSIQIDPKETDADFPMYTHEGILRTAKALKRHLTKGIRKQIFVDFLVENPDWNVVVCGHSLGAAVAILLAILLRKDFPKIRAFAFSSPALLNQRGASWAKSFVTSLVYGDDIVPRLSLNTLTRLRAEMIEQYALVASEKLHKVFFRREKEKDNENRKQIDSTVMNKMEEWKLAFDESSSIQLYLPGQIIHVDTFDESRTCGCTLFCGQQPLVYAAQNPSNLQRIWINSRSIPDHMPHHYDRCLDYIIRHMKQIQSSKDLNQESIDNYSIIKTP